ncbi:MAG: hypothetical protein HC888_08410 [Candidatus Competibacteraceae bacterium]|nr:hypothetical protein [Candidatus Competibacteraceae bacterium]
MERGLAKLTDIIIIAGMLLNPIVLIWLFPIKHHISINWWIIIVSSYVLMSLLVLCAIFRRYRSSGGFKAALKLTQEGSYYLHPHADVEFHAWTDLVYVSLDTAMLEFSGGRRLCLRLPGRDRVSDEVWQAIDARYSAYVAPLREASLAYSTRENQFLVKSDALLWAIFATSLVSVLGLLGLMNDYWPIVLLGTFVPLVIIYVWRLHRAELAEAKRRQDALSRAHDDDSR